MSTAAIAAQGTTLHIAGSAAAGLNLASCSVGYPTILTFVNATVATALQNGDSVAITLASGDDAALLNVTTTVSHKAIGATDTTFTVDINTTGKTIVGTSAVATPTAWIKVGNVKGFKPSNPTTSERVTTDLDSTAVETGGGLKDFGTVSLDNFVIVDDAGQAAIKAAFLVNSTPAGIKVFKVTYPGGTTPIRTFSGWVKEFPDMGDASIDGSVSGTMSIRRTSIATVS